MNIASSLPAPFNEFVIDIPAKEYYDFELGADSTYPLKGVTYPVDYGHIAGYTTEDGDELDLFVGNTKDGKTGTIAVDRGPEIGTEHKFYVAMTDEELQLILGELKPVLVSNDAAKDANELVRVIQTYKDK